LSPAFALDKTLHFSRLITNAYCIDPGRPFSFTFLHSLGRLPPTAVWLESSLSTRRFIVAMIIS
jgi:hypothetical protein